MSPAAERVLSSQRQAVAIPYRSPRSAASSPERSPRRSAAAGPATAGRSTATPATGIPALAWRRRYRRGVLATDLAVVAAATTLGGFLSAQASTGPILSPVLTTALVVSIWVLMLHLFRTRAPLDMAVGNAEYKRVFEATAATGGLYAMVALLLNGTGGRYHLLVELPAGLAGLLLGRWFWRSWLQRRRLHGCALSDVVVVGQPADVQYVLRQIEKKSGAAYRVVGVVLDGAVTVRDEAEVAAASGNVPGVVGAHQVTDAVDRLGADAVIVAGPLAGGNQAIRDLGWSLEAARTEFILVPSLTHVAGPRFSVRPVEGLPLMHVGQPAFEGGPHLVKRSMDLVLSALALLVLSPVFAVLAVLISRDSPGGVFFTQTRTGLRGQPFSMVKFRTMRATAEREKAALLQANEGAGPLFKLKDDPRVTRIGAFLRRHSLDELPQLWNVLTGDMSLVGPRPPLPDEVASYAGHEGRRLFIKPGMTGLWQVSGRSNLGWDESVRLDLYYVENWSVTGDLQIMWRTLNVMIKPEGAF
jgi:exopolysaccharide biosynthesis polyprenyl glycosylphosphotransferase